MKKQKLVRGIGKRGKPSHLSSQLNHYGKSNWKNYFCHGQNLAGQGINIKINTWGMKILYKLAKLQNVTVEMVES